MEKVARRIAREKKEERERIRGMGATTIWLLGTVEAKTARGAFPCELETPSTMPWEQRGSARLGVYCSGRSDGVRALQVERARSGNVVAESQTLSDNSDVTKNSP